MNYEQDVRINEKALDVEWLDQPELAIKYGREWVAAKKKVALLDEKLKVTRSELIKEAISDPEKAFGVKLNTVSDTKAESYYRTHKKHKKIKQQLIEAQEELDLLEIIKNEVSFSRKTALENLTKLHIADYFAGPNVPRNLTNERNKRDAERGKAKELSTPIKRKNKKNK